MGNQFYLTSANIDGKTMKFAWYKETRRIIVFEEKKDFETVVWEGGYEEAFAETAEAALKKVEYLIQMIKQRNRYVWNLN